MAALFARVVAKTVALTATTTATVIGVQTATNQAIRITQFSVSFDGAVSTNAPAVIEWGFLTFATNAPGTNSTSQAAQKQDSARPETIQSTGGKTWTVEPTVYTIVGNMDLAQFNGSWVYITPYYAPLIAKGANGFGIRVTSPNNVNCTAELCFEE